MHWFFLIFFIALLGCSTVRDKPCVWAGDPSGSPLAADQNKRFAAKIKCQQAFNPQKKLLNHGLYREWDQDEKALLIGNYNFGKKSGVWKHFDTNGKVQSTQYFKNGVEVTENEFMREQEEQRLKQ